jgi:hypothetical protein
VQVNKGRFHETINKQSKQEKKKKTLYEEDFTLLFGFS